MEHHNIEKYKGHIRSLTFDSLAGIIAPEDLEDLIRALESSESAREEWLEIMTRIERDNIYQRLAESQELPEEVKAVLNNLIRQEARKRSGSRYLLVAGIVAAAAFVVVVFFVHLVNTGGSNALPKQITLTTSDGATIALTGTKTIQTADATLFNQDSALSFEGVGNEGIINRINTLTVPSGLDFKITLSDGTLVWMNAATTLSFPFRFADKREITLTGEAYIDVAPHSDKPFIVHLPGGRSVKVLGTSFNVNAYEEKSARISLISGAVKVDDGKATVALKPGYEAICANGTVNAATFEEADVLAWREGKYYLKNMPLMELTALLNRNYGVDIVIDNPQLDSLRYSGRLDKHSPIAVVLENAVLTTGIQYYYKDKVLHIK
jgi:ferric-dicitrate binding protein FerR (iron transport regulator)